MTKDNILFGIIGLLAGCIVGFMFANSVNQNAAKAPIAANSVAGAANNADLPPDHPSVSGAPVLSPQSKALIDQAKAEPENFAAQMKGAEAAYRQRDFANAIALLKQANKLKPDDYETIVNLGNATYDSENFEEAEKWYTAALEKKADDTNVRTDLGLTFIFRTPPDYDRAIAEFKKTLEIDPNQIQAHQNLTVAYTKKGDIAKAKETLAKLESIDPKNSAVPKLREEIDKTFAK